MSEVLQITQRSAQVAEGYANGLTDRQLGKALRLDEETINSHSTGLYRDLGVGGNQHSNPRCRAISMLIAADVLQLTDQKLPYEPYVSTMRPSPDSPIQYWPDTHRTTEMLPSFHMPPNNKGRRATKVLGEREFSALERTILSCKSLGMSGQDIIEAGIASSIGSVGHHTKKLIKSLGVLNISHAVAFAAHYDLISIKPEILVRDKTVQPIHYTAGRTVIIDRPSYRS